MAEFYEPIKPESPYDSDNLIQHYEGFKDINKYLQTLQEDSENTNAWQDSGQLLRKNPFYYFRNKRSPRPDLESAVSEEYNSLGKYAKTHSNHILDDFVPEDYVELVQKVPLYKIGDEEHDKFVDALNQVRKLEEISRDSKKMYSYIGEKIGKAPRWVQESFARFGKNDFEMLFEQYLISAHRDLEPLLYKTVGDKKEVRKNFLEKVFKDSLNEAEDALKDEDYSESEKNDVWEANIRPYYFALIEESYKKEKADEEIPKTKEDRNERRKERREKGMPF